MHEGRSAAPAHACVTRGSGCNRTGRCPPLRRLRPGNRALLPHPCRRRWLASSIVGRGTAVGVACGQLPLRQVPGAATAGEGVAREIGPTDARMDAAADDGRLRAEPASTRV